MRAVVTRVTEASCSINGNITSSIGLGLLVLLAIGPDDDESTATLLASKVSATRIFSDDKGKMNLALADVGGEILVISQFTLYADCKKRRPSFSKAMEPVRAEKLYLDFVKELEKAGASVKTGEFAADMQIASVNDGPVTLIFDTADF